MTNRNDLNNTMQKGTGWRRLLALLCAIMLLITSTGITVFAEEDDGIISDPVTAPVNQTAEETPGPDGDVPEGGEDTPEGTPEETTEEVTEDVPEETPEETPEPTPDRVYYPGTLTAETEGCSIRVDYTADARIPEDAALAIDTAKGADLYTALKSASKLIRNEEDATWEQRIAEEGNLFYTVSITDAEGNTVEPHTGVTLTYQNPESPAEAVYFLTGEAGRELTIEEGTLTIPDYRMDAFGYAFIEKVQTGTVTLEYKGQDYTVTAAYGPEAGFPADTALKVKEILPGTSEYAMYSGLTEDTLSEEWSEITLERFFDITFVSGGAEMEPQADVDVQIIFNSKIELTDEHDVTAVHIENNEATVIASDTESSSQEAQNDGEAIDTVAFSSDSFSVYGVVQRTKITSKVLAADGQTYEIEVTYGPEAEIPEDAELRVTEIPEGSDLWEAYRKQTAAALGADDVRLPGLYDITILDAEGNEVEPKAPVNVSIKLANADEGEDELHVVHFTEEIPEELVEAAAAEKDEEQGEAQPLAEEDRIASETITEKTVEGDTVTFDTNGFSVYAFAYLIETFYKTAGGETFRITLSYGKEAGIPEDAELAVSEILPEDEAYEEYYSEAANAAMEAAKEKGSELPMATGGRLFDIEILGENGKIEPSAPVRVAIELISAGKTDMLSVVHFADDGTEVLALKENPERDNGGVNEVRFEADSFSVYTVVNVDNLENQGQYIIASGIAGDPGAEVGYGESWGTDYFTRVVNGMAITDEPNEGEHGLDSIGIHWWKDGNQYYVGGDATAWTLVRNNNTDPYSYYIQIEKGGTTYYFRWYGYDRGDGNTEWDGMTLTDNPGLATAFGIEDTGDNDGTVYIYLAQEGFYKERYLRNYQYSGTNEWSSRCYRLSSARDVDLSKSEAKFRICKKSEDLDPMAAQKVSVQSLTTNTNYIIYRKIEDAEGNEELYALASDGTFVRVFEGGDLIYYRETDKDIFWNYQQPSGVYLQSLYNGNPVYISPQASTGQTIVDTSAHSLTLSGKSTGTYGSTIESWDQAAYDYAGLHVELTKDSQGNTTAVRLTAGKHNAGKSDEFLFAVASQMPSNTEPTIVETVDSSALGLKITLYDYGNPDTDYGFGTKLSGMTSAVGSDAYTPHEAHALVKGYLDPESGLPLPSGSDTPMTGVFGNSTDGDITQIIEGVNHLFLQSYYNESGTFRFRSEDNHAYIPLDGSNKNFTVYEQIATPYTTDRQVGHAYFYHGHFMPFNDIDMTNHVSRLLDQYGTTPLSLEDGRSYEDVYGVLGNPNYFTGVKMEANFVQPSDGKLESGADMVFKFTGDDDMWVYIDGILVLDIGGIHEPLSGSINFATGKVINPVGSGITETTLRNIFMSVLNDPNTPQSVKDTITQIEWDGDTFADFTTHSFKAFYMERGAGASNLDLQFNLKVAKTDEFTVRKELPEGVDTRFVNQIYKYQATYRHGNEILPLHAGITGVCSSITYKDARNEDGEPITVNVPVDENGYFYLRAGEAAIFHMAAENVEYNVKEVEIDTDLISQVDINNTTNVPITADTETPANGNIAEAGFAKTHKRGEVAFTNYPITQNLLITKHLTEDSAALEADELPTFEFHVYIESTMLNEDGTVQTDENGEPVTKLVPYSYGPYYLVKDGAYYTLTGENNAPVRQGTVPVLCSTTGRSGSINSIPPEYTVLIPDIASGTHFYVEERIDEKGLKGFEFVSIELEEGTYDEQTMCDTTGPVDEEDVLERVLASDETTHQDFEPSNIGKIKSGEDAQVHVNNKKPSVEIPLQKKWETSSPELPTITLALIRYKGPSPEGQQIVIGDDKGAIIIRHYVDFGGGNEVLPDGFRATYTITDANGQAVYENVSIGNYDVDPGTYTVTATILDPGDVPSSYAYSPSASTETVSGLVVIQDQGSIATLVARYDTVPDGSITISHNALFTGGTLDGSTTLPEGFRASYTIKNSSGQNVYTDVAAGTYDVAPGSYTVVAHVSNNAQPTDYYYKGTPDQTVTVSSSADSPVTLTSTYQYEEAAPLKGSIHINREFEGFTPNNFQAQYHIYNNTTNELVRGWLNNGDTWAVDPGEYRVEAVINYQGDNISIENLENVPAIVTVVSEQTAEATVVHRYAGPAASEDTTVFLCISTWAHHQEGGDPITLTVKKGSTIILNYHSYTIQHDGWVQTVNPNWHLYFSTGNNSYHDAGQSGPAPNGDVSIVLGDKDEYCVCIFTESQFAYGLEASITPAGNNGGSVLRNPGRRIASNGIVSGGFRMRAAGDQPDGGTSSGPVVRDLVNADLANLIIPTKSSVGIPDDYTMDTDFGKIVTLSDPWIFTFEGLAERDKYGNEYYYVLVEVVPVNYVADYQPQALKASEIRARMDEIAEAKEAGTVPPVQLSLAVTNTKVTGDLIVEKKVHNRADTVNTFTFEITLTPPTEQTTPYYDQTLKSSYNAIFTDADGVESNTTVSVENNKITVSLKADEQIRILDLPDGTGYSVTETGTLPTGYTEGTHSNASGTIEKNQTKTATMNNNYDNSITAQIEGLKEVTNALGTNPKAGYTFTLTADDNAPMPTGDGDTAVSGNDGSFAFGVITYTMTDVMNDNERDGNGIYTRVFTYKVKENVPSPDVTDEEIAAGHAVRSNIEYDLSEKEATVTVTYNWNDGTMTQAVSPEQTGLQITNDQKRATLKVTKTIKASDTIPGGTYTYPIVISTVIDGNTRYIQDTDGTLGDTPPETPLTVTAGAQDTPGAELTIVNLPFGTYTVTETDPEDISITGFRFITADRSGDTVYAQSITETSAAITDYLTPGTAGLVNCYVKDTSWNHDVYKQLNSTAYTEGVEGYDGYTFELAEAESQNTIPNDTHSMTAVTDETGKASFEEIVYQADDLEDGQDSREFFYTITEVRPDAAQDDPYIADGIRYDPKTIYAVVTVSKADPENDSPRRLQAEAKFYSDAEHTAELTDTYFDNTETGTLTVTKNVTGDYTAEDKTFRFTVQNGDGQYIDATVTENPATYAYDKLSDEEITYDIAKDQTITFINLPAGTYTVTEGDAAETGYITTTTYQVGDDTENRTDDCATAEVTRNGQADVTIINDYQAVTEISVTKEWNDAEGNPKTVGDDESITFTLYRRVGGASGSIVAENLTVLYGQNAEYTFSDGTLGERTDTDTADGWGTTLIRDLPLWEVSGEDKEPVTYYVVEADSGMVIIQYTTDGTPADTCPDADSGTITIINTDAETELTVIKISDDETPQYLAGAVFTLVEVDEDGNAIQPVNSMDSEETNAEDGKISFSSLKPGYYRIYEKKAPNGYLETKESIIIHVAVNGGEVTAERVGTDTLEMIEYEPETGTVTVKNSAGAELPNTGGSGTAIYTIGGLALILLAGILLADRKRKNRA